MKNTLCLIVLFFNALGLLAQSEAVERCGTQDGRTDWLIRYQENPDQYIRTNDWLYVPLTIHVVGDDNGFGYYPLHRILNALCVLNTDFEVSNIRFFIEGDIRYINNSDYYDHDFSQGAQMMDENNVANTINCYIVLSPAGNCGYSAYNRGIALNKGCISESDHTWAHEIGHYLSLPHTFFGWEGIEHPYAEVAPASVNYGRETELVDGSNCLEASDGFCDTPADYLNFRWSCNSEAFSNVLQHDPNGVEFRSDGTFFMSYSFDECAERFSEEQIGAMRANLLTERENLLYNQTPPVLIEATEIQAIQPLEESLVENVNSVTLIWEEVAGAEQYIVQLSPVPTFAIGFQTHLVSENQVIVYNLWSDRTWYWRVRPFNSYDPCADFSTPFSFETGNFILDVSDFAKHLDWNVSPNPLNTKDQFLQLNLNAASSFDANLKLIHANGQQMKQWKAHFISGKNVERLEMGLLQPGIYFLVLESDRGSAMQRLVVY